MRKALCAGITGVAGTAAWAAAASLWEPRVHLHRCDWSIHDEGSSRRTYRSLSHFLFHLRELLSVQIPMAEVYLLRAISPAFRERIMLVTAYANECSW
jgi:hypothetical protein